MFIENYYISHECQRDIQFKLLYLNYRLIIQISILHRGIVLLLYAATYRFLISSSLCENSTLTLNFANRFRIVVVVAIALLALLLRVLR